MLSTRTPHQIRPLIRSDFSTYTEIMCSSYLHHHPPKWLLFSALLLCLIVLSDQASTCSTVGQLKCKCINLTTFNCSWASINIMPIMLDPRLKVLDLSHNQIKRIHDLNSIYISIEHLDISYNLLNSNESSMFESKNLKVGFSCFKKRVFHSLCVWFTLGIYLYVCLINSLVYESIQVITLWNVPLISVLRTLFYVNHLFAYRIIIAIDSYNHSPLNSPCPGLDHTVLLFFNWSRLITFILRDSGEHCSC